MNFCPKTYLNVMICTVAKNGLRKYTCFNDFHSPKQLGSSFLQTTAGAEIFPVLCSHWLCGHASAPDAHSLGLKWSVYEAVHSPFVIMAWCLINFKGYFIFYTYGLLYEAYLERKDTSHVGRWGNFLCIV
jgi:hypothetical protein